MTAKPYHHGDLRNAVLRTARAALRTTPPEELSLRQLAREAGVSANAPYRHFADRDVLLRDLALEGFQSLTSLIRDRTSTGVLGARLQRLADTYREFALAEPGLFRLMFRPAPDASAELIEAFESFFAEMVAALEESGKDADPEQSLRRTAGVWMAIHGATLCALDGSLDWLDSWLRPGIDELGAAVWNGMRRGGGRS